ncbi:MAG: NUDIX domain-containing protein [Flavobacteriaceae bacterium]|jgi:ADP-ribose pyrophosphatase YjhB (NUDIX family)|nr:NUDIX domain-containing protein [Flavobacteriaceae bacterium]
MYKIFYLDKPIVITDVKSDNKNVHNIKFKDFNLKKALKNLSKTNISSIRIVGKDKEKLLKKFLKLLPKIIAAGGKVFNQKGEILFIFRNNKWDLPKGKAEYNESIADTAIREVKEETGVNKLVITKPLEITYHIFKKNNTFRLKVTYWFEMKSMADNQLIPQFEEGITKAEWINNSEIDKIKKKCYANIRLLI